MKKSNYRLKRDIPELYLKKGDRFKSEGEGIQIWKCAIKLWIPNSWIPQALADGTIEEIEENEFTKTDMQDYAEFVTRNPWQSNSWQMWLNQRGDQ